MTHWDIRNPDGLGQAGFLSSLWLVSGSKAEKFWSRRQASGTL